MQCIVNLLGQRLADALDLSQVIDSGGHHPAQTAKARQHLGQLRVASQLCGRHINTRSKSRVSGPVPFIMFSS